MEAFRTCAVLHLLWRWLIVIPLNTCHDNLNVSIGRLLEHMASRRVTWIRWSVAGLQARIIRFLGVAGAVSVVGQVVVVCVRRRIGAVRTLLAILRLDLGRLLAAVLHVAVLSGARRTAAHIITVIKLLVCGRRRRRVRLILLARSVAAGGALNAAVVLTLAGVGGMLRVLAGGAHLRRELILRAGAAAAAAGPDRRIVDRYLFL